MQYLEKIEIDQKQLNMKNKRLKLYKSKKISFKEYVHDLYMQYYGDDI